MGAVHTIRSAIFDLDGTLVDSAHDIRAALAAAYASIGRLLDARLAEKIAAFLGKDPDRLLAMERELVGRNLDAGTPIGEITDLRGTAYLRRGMPAGWVEIDSIIADGFATGFVNRSCFLRHCKKRI